MPPQMPLGQPPQRQPSLGGDWLERFGKGLGLGLGEVATQKTQAGKSGSGGSHPERSIWLWGTLIPVLLAATRLMVVSGGDPETLRSLVQNLNITALVLATVLPLASTVLTILAFFMVVQVHDVRKNRAFAQQWSAQQQSPAQQHGLTQEQALALEQWVAQQKVLAQQHEWTDQQLVEQLQALAQRPATPWASAVALVLIIFAIDVFAMPMLYVLINVGIVVALALFTIATRKSLQTEGRLAKARGFFRIAAVVVAIILVGVPLVFWIALSGVWLPKERLTINGSSTGVVYVLSSDDQWTKYLDDGHQVHIVSTRDVTYREPVMDRREWKNLTLSEVFASW